MSRIDVTPTLSIPESDLTFQFTRASGPGGQNVNKVATAVQLRYDVTNATLPEQLKSKLKKIAGNKLTQDGIIVIHAKRYRSQDKNRQDAIQRLIKLIQAATEVRKPRKKSYPSRAWHERRLQEKRQRSQLKKSRQQTSDDE